MERLFAMIVLLFCAVVAMELKGIDVAAARSLVADADSRAKQTMDGLFHYYWRKDAQVNTIAFFFACGQIGSGEPGSESCTCENTISCTSCYRWWDAIAMESVATYGIYTNSKNNSNIPDIIFAHSPYNSNWPADTYCTFIDDFAWYGIAYLRVYEWLKVQLVLAI